MAALELVADREKKIPAEKTTMATVANGAYDAGVMLRVAGPYIILSPPLVVTKDDIQKLGEGLDAGLAKA
jgi:adenosylmethionine-8-amino-7-oxononanoate aminotransferase